MFKKKKELNTNDDFFSDGGGAAESEHDPLMDSESLPMKKTVPKSRLLLLLLLVLVIVAGGYFYLFPTVEEAPPAPPTQVRKPIPIPIQPAAGQSIAAPVTKENPAPATAKPAPAVAPVAAAPPAQKISPPVAQAPAPAAEKVKPAAVAKVAPSAPTAGKYTIEAGTFLVKTNRQSAEKMVSRLGYKAKITTVQRPVKMTRLRVGGPYTPMAAEARLAELLPLVPTAFSIPDGDEMTVYAGSFFLGDQVRVVTEKLAKEGIHIDEEIAEVNMPLEMVTFGSFADKEAAAEVMAKARAAGLKPAIIRK